MSRETDRSSTGPQGRGSGAYPPGTDPYGAALGAGDTAPPGGGPDSSAPEPDEPLTETTLTTRVRINIPGSRPIPPVVMRTPVNSEPESADTPADDPPTPSGSPPASGIPAPVGSAAGGDASDDAGREEPRTSDWFAPRKPPTGGRSAGAHPSGGPSGGPAGGSGGVPPGGPPGGPPPGPPRSRGIDPDASPYAEPDDRDRGGDDGRTLMFGAGPAGGRVPGAPPGPEPTADDDHPRTPPDGVPAVTGPTDSAAGPGSPGGGARGPGRSVGTTLPLGFSLPSDAPPMSPPPGGGGPRGTEPRPGDTPGSPSPFDRPAGLGGDPFAPSGGSPAPEPQGVSDTLHSGIPVVRPDGPRPPTAPLPGPPLSRDLDGPRDPDGPGDTAESPAPSKPARKGRSKLVLVAVAVVGVVGIAYGAGLLLDHAEVPNGTTVLGVEVGGTSKQEAVETLEEQLGDRINAPLNLTVGERKVELKPSVAGLSVDIDATVRNAAGRDYNPVTVIGSLMGGAREATAEITVDEEKLHAALEELAGGGGTADEGTVRFQDGQATAVYGKPHEALDVARAAESVESAYRDRAATGENPAISLPTAKQKPKVSKAEVDRALKEFGKPAMSGWLWVRAGSVEVPFSEDTLSELLSMQPVDKGTLQPKVDLKKLEEAYGGAFDGVTIDAASGPVPITAKHVATAMVEALRQQAPAAPEKRVAEVEGATAG